MTDHGMWFEEFNDGMTLTTKGRTITEADLVNFAGVSGDFNPMHTDAEFAKGTHFGARVAHGALIFSIATGLAYQTNFIEGTVIAFMGMDWKFKAAVFVGDTVKVALTVAKHRAMVALGGGLVWFNVEVTNQKGEVVQRGEWQLLVRSNSVAETAGNPATESAASA